MGQVAMLIDLNKCIGCQTCTAACKSMWTDEPGQDYMLWNNVETKPGRGYPVGWEAGGGGWTEHGQLRPGRLADRSEHGMEMEKGDSSVTLAGAPMSSPRSSMGAPQPPASLGSGRFRILDNEHRDAGDDQGCGTGGCGSNWDEDTSSGVYPNNYHFYLPRLCNHCTRPSCLESCPTRAIYKREKDGIVLIDQDKCKGFRECNRACPYDKIYFNYVTGKSQKCIFCFPRLEEGVAPACARQCPGRLRFVGFLEDTEGPIHRLVNEWRVALPLHAEFGTEPNVFYVPPMLPPTFDAAGRLSEEPRLPKEYLRELFGPRVDRALETLAEEMAKRESGEPSELMDVLIAKDWKSLFNIPDVRYF